MNIDMSEKELQWEVVRLAGKHDVLCFHVPDSRMSFGSGFVDSVLSGTKKTIFCELKVDDTSKGYLKPNQREWKERLQSSGQEYYLWRPRHLLSGEIESIIRGLND
jgi:hypothetical protein